MAKIFFGCSMRGGYSRLGVAEIVKLQDIIEGMGHELVSRHQTKPNVFKEEARLTEREIHDRDYSWLMDAQIGIFEISNPSLGAGGEITDMLNLGKPVLCLFKKELSESVSAYIRGKQGSHYVKAPLECYAYSNQEDAKSKIEQFIRKYASSR